MPTALPGYASNRRLRQEEPPGVRAAPTHAHAKPWAWHTRLSDHRRISDFARFATTSPTTAASSRSGGHVSFWAAVVTRPVPSGLVRRSLSPGRAPALVKMRFGWTRPVTA